MKSFKIGLFCLKLRKFRKIHDKIGLFFIFEQGKIYKSLKPRRGKFICCLNLLQAWEIVSSLWWLPTPTNSSHCRYPGMTWWLHRMPPTSSRTPQELRSSAEINLQTSLPVFQELTTWYHELIFYCLTICLSLCGVSFWK